MRKHDVGGAIQGFVVGTVKPITFNGRMKQAVDFPKKVCDVFIRDVTAVVLKQVIDSDEEVGEGVEPREPGILLKKREQRVDRLDRTIDPFVGQLLRDNQSPVKPDQAFSNREQGAPARVNRNKGRRIG